jgi:hypothetical protein
MESSIPIAFHSRMKLHHQFHIASVVAALALTACGSREQGTPPSNPAVESHSSPAAPSSAASPFERVMGRLDMGGKMLEIHDHDGRRENDPAIAATAAPPSPWRTRNGRHTPPVAPTRSPKPFRRGACSPAGAAMPSTRLPITKIGEVPILLYIAKRILL